MSSEVKLGYKWTEAGVIPEDWCIKPLAELCTFENGDRGKNYPSPGSFVSSGIPFINAGHLSNGNIDLRQMDYISPERFNKLGGGKVRNGDILFCLRGSLGKFGVITSEITCGAIASSLVIIRQKSSSITQEYLISYFSSELCASMIEIWAGGAAQPNLGAQDLAKFLVAMPQSQDEQKKIASALADADALISSLDQLIAKKRDIQQATMQQLLTGQRRLPGFSGNWEKKNLESISAFITKGSTPTTYGFGWVTQGVLFLRSECVSANGLDLSQAMFISEEAHSALRRSEIKAGDLLMTITGNVGRIVLLDSSCDCANINQHIARIRISCANTDSRFVFHYLSRKEIRDRLEKITTGQAYPQLSLKQVRELVVELPPLAEQTAIANALSEMATELASLEARRDKARQLKQGMMQELLSGRVRLSA